ncbi:hypothetical protein [Streptomyces sp. NBC_01171]|nr:hypothetical protein OG448_30320 [Streptomyces sp. NBC_01171]
MLLAQVARDITPLKDALQAAIDHLQTSDCHIPRVGQERREPRDPTMSAT